MTNINSDLNIIPPESDSIISVNDTVTCNSYDKSNSVSKAQGFLGRSILFQVFLYPPLREVANERYKLNVHSLLVVSSFVMKQFFTS
jgi:hypothetical protein